MPIVFRCENCDHRYRVPDDRAGQTARCRHCGGELRVPLPGPRVETSPSGSPILRHAPRRQGFTPPEEYGPDLESLTGHIEEHLGGIDFVFHELVSDLVHEVDSAEVFLGGIDFVFHELVSDLVHLDVHHVPPAPDRPWRTLITTGMSDRPMNAPVEVEEYRHAELMIRLPASWPVSEDDFAREENYWPVRLLKILARLPHEYDTWLGVGHTVPNGDPPAPYAAGTGFACALLLPPMNVPDEFHRLVLSPEKIVHFHAVVPIYAEETNFKLRRGVEPLLDRFDRHGVGDVVDVGRRNVCGGWFSWLRRSR